MKLLAPLLTGLCIITTCSAWRMTLLTNETIAGTAGTRKVEKTGIIDRHCGAVEPVPGGVKKVVFEAYTYIWRDPHELEIFAEPYCRERIARFEDGTHLLDPPQKVRSFRVQ